MRAELLAALGLQQWLGLHWLNLADVQCKTSTGRKTAILRTQHPYLPHRRFLAIVLYFRGATAERQHHTSIVVKRLKSVVPNLPQ